MDTTYIFKSQKSGNLPISSIAEIWITKLSQHLLGNAHFSKGSTYEIPKISRCARQICQASIREIFEISEFARFHLLRGGVSIRNSPVVFT